MKYKVLIIISCIWSIAANSYAQWSRVSSVPALDIVAFAEAHNTMFAASDSNIVFKSIDGGINWSPIVIGNNSIRMITISIIDDTIYVGTSTNGIFRSANFGSNWTNMGNALQAITGIIKEGDDLFASSLGDGVYKYNRLNNSWGQFNNLLPNYSVNVNSIIDAGGRPLIAAGANGTTYLFDSISHTWDEGFYYGLLRPGLLIQQLKKDSNNIFAVNGDYIIKSDDNGLTWTNDNFDASNGYSRILSVGSEKDFILTNIIPTGTWVQQRMRNSTIGSSWANDEEFIPVGYSYDIIEFENKLFLGKEDGLYVKNFATSIESDTDKQEENFQVQITGSSSLSITGNGYVKQCTVMNASGQIVLAGKSGETFTTESLSKGVYVVSVLMPNGKSITKKVVLE
jgi:photosystem II stability/assembly factor-like uncharacterized protein